MDLASTLRSTGALALISPPSERSPPTLHMVWVVSALRLRKVCTQYCIPSAKATACHTVGAK